MIYEIKDNAIIILDKSQFDIKQILECGQVFRYELWNNCANVYSLDKKAEIIFDDKSIIINCNDINYFINYFDLNNDYNLIKNKLNKFNFLIDAIAFGAGIRILKQDLLETIISFIISANNNIKRIKNSIFYLANNFGTNMGNYCAFPTLEQLQKLSIEDFVKAGLGYRAKQLYETLKMLDESKLQNLKLMDLSSKQSFLISLKGVGEKVCDCILLFALNEQMVFPVDTWINKIYNLYFEPKSDNRFFIRKKLVDIFGYMSGYCQQYLFYYIREYLSKQK